jgi:hypothetical protein
MIFERSRSAALSVRRLDQDVLPAAVFVTLRDPVAFHDLAGLGIDELLS